MKIFKTIIYPFITFFLFSCNKGGLVDKTYSDAYFYSLDKSKIYHKHSSSPDVSKLWNYEWNEVPANAKTFRVMKGGFGKDDKHIFFGSKIIENVDYASFHQVADSDNFSDIYKVYTPSLKIIEGANPATYEVIKSVSEDYGRYRSYAWAKDDQHFFYKNKNMEVDFPSFKILTRTIMVDKDSIYAREFDEFRSYPNGNKLDEKFTVLDDYMVYTSKYFYFNYLFTSKVKGIKILPILDSESIIQYSFRDYFAIDGQVYYNASPIQEADAASFVASRPGDAVFFAKDKNHVYLRDKILPDISPEEVIFDAKNDQILYRGKKWNWQTEAFDDEEKIKK